MASHLNHRFSKPVSAWRYTPPPDRAPTASGDGMLSDALLAEEAAFGPTAAVVEAYATALVEQWGDQLAAFTPLGFAAGQLTAAAVYAPLLIPGLQYVQADSVEVCELYAPHVPWLKVDSRAAVEALVAAPGCVTRVDVYGIEPFEIEAPFELRWCYWSGDDRAPHWFRRWDHRPFYAQLAPLGRHAWLCWDLDHHELVSVRDGGLAEAGVHLGDIFPNDAHRRGSAPTRRHAGAGWAATAEYSGTSTAAADGRRFLSCDEHVPGVRQLAEFWLARRPFAELPKNSHGTFASIELSDARDATSQQATLQWIGRHRVLRIRSGHLEQLTRDHDMRWLVAEDGFDEPVPDKYLTNMIAKSLPLGEPDTITVDVSLGDRFVLLPAGLQELLEQATEDLAHALAAGTVEQVTRWIRAVATTASDAAVAVVLDADAHAAWTPFELPPPPPSRPRKTTVTSLVAQPAQFADQRISARGVFHSRFEGMSFADAWFRCEPDFPTGAWLVDAEGTWRHGGRYGHFGLSASELIGTATRVPIDRPREVPPARGRTSRQYVPLTTTATVHQGLQGWTWEGQWLNRVGATALFPSPAAPQEVDLELKYFIDGWRNIGVFSWRVIAQRALEPTPKYVRDQMERGALVRVCGILSPPQPLEHMPEEYGPLADWPLLDGVLPVIPPGIAATSSRHEIARAARLQPIADAVGTGAVVVVIAEVGPNALWAHSIQGPDGEIDVDIL